MTTQNDLEEIRRKIALANVGWPYPFVCGFVDGMLDGMEGNGPEMEMCNQIPETRAKGYRVGYRYYSSPKHAGHGAPI